MWPFKPKAPEQPPIWDLADIMPELDEALIGLRQAAADYDPQNTQQTDRIRKAFNRVERDFDNRIEDFLFVAKEQGQALAAQQENPNKEQLRGLYDDYCTLTHEFARVGKFGKLLCDEYYKVPEAQKFFDHSQERCAQVFHAFKEVWQNISLSPEQVEQVTGHPANATDLGQRLLPKAPPQPYVSVEEQRTQQETKDPRLANFQRLYAQIAGSPKMPLAEQSRLTAHMFSALVYQHQNEAAAAGHDTFSLQAEKQSLPADLLQSYLPTVENFKQQSFLTVPRGKEKQPQYSWSEATDIVVSAFEQFHPEMGEIARNAIADGWIHASPNKEKFGNAYALGTLKSSMHPANHPYMLVHFDGSFQSLRCLAHELGHAVVTQLEGEQRVQNLDPGALHETFAHFASAIAGDEALSRASEPAEKMGIMREIRNSTYRTINFQTQLATFEAGLYDIAKAQEFAPLSEGQVLEAILQAGLHMPDTSNMSAEEAKKAQQTAVVNNGKVSHFTHQHPHYVVNYVLAESGAQALREDYTAMPADEKTDFANRWVEVMRNAPHYNYGKAMKHMGLDIQGDTLLEPAQHHIQELNSQIAEIAEQLEKTPPARPSFRDRLLKQSSSQAQAPSR